MPYAWRPQFWEGSCHSVPLQYDQLNRRRRQRAAELQRSAFGFEFLHQCVILLLVDPVALDGERSPAPREMGDAQRVVLDALRADLAALQTMTAGRRQIRAESIQ